MHNVKRLAWPDDILSLGPSMYLWPHSNISNQQVILDTHSVFLSSGKAKPSYFGVLFVCFWSHCTACMILVSQPGIKPGPIAVEAQNFNHWTAKEGPKPSYFVKRTEFIIVLLCLETFSAKWAPASATWNFIHLFIQSYTQPPSHLSTYLSKLCIYLFIHPYTHPFIHPSIQQTFIHFHGTFTIRSSSLPPKDVLSPC